MFYIEKTKLKQRDKMMLRVVPALVVFLAFFGVTLIIWVAARNDVKNEQFKLLTENNQEVATYLRQRMTAYEDVLRGGVGLFSSSTEVTRDEWRQYIDSYKLNDRYPGIQGVGYSEVVPPDQLASHTARIRRQGFPEYKIYPEGERNPYTAVIYIEPFEGANARVLGFDMYSETVRREAMDKSRDSADAVVSDIVTLQQEETFEDRQKGFLMYLPHYRPGFAPETIAQRQRELAGYVYAPFRAGDLMAEATKDRPDEYAFRVSNITSEMEVFYQDATYDEIGASENSQWLATDIRVPGALWRIEGVASRNIVNADLRSRPAGSFVGGLVFSIVVAALIYMLLVNRSHMLTQKEDESIQEAKDELLALASHQLRTPATGVKQYVGMLKEGLAGELTTMQQRLLDKAYESNERQLGIINEMLFVARSDAGHLKMEREDFDFKELVANVIQDQTPSITAKEQKIKVSLPKNPVMVHGDKQYLRMAVDNLVSNATKYTKDGGTIRINLTSSRNSIVCQVKDNGVGVPKEDRHLLFQKFSRVPNELTGKVSGSGIGLYLVKQVVEAHGGTVEYDSEADNGSVFTIRMPHQQKGPNKQDINPQ